jgi:hypothetical protein
MELGGKTSDVHFLSLEENLVFVTNQFAITCNYLSFVTIIGYFFSFFCIWLRLQLHYNYLVINVFIFLPFEQFLTWFSSKKTHLCFISCKFGQMSYKSMCIQSVF